MRFFLLSRFINYLASTNFLYKKNSTFINKKCLFSLINNEIKNFNQIIVPVAYPGFIKIKSVCYSWHKKKIKRVCKVF